MKTVVKRKPFEARVTEFINLHPEWADMVYTILYRREQQAHFNLQYAVMQAMMLAYKMGQEGREPPRPKRMDPRRLEEPDADPEIDEVYNELLMMAWSPKTGQPRPEGHIEWVRSRRRALPPTPPVVVARRRR